MPCVSVGTYLVYVCGVCDMEHEHMSVHCRYFKLNLTYANTWHVSNQHARHIHGTVRIVLASQCIAWLYHSLHRHPTRFHTPETDTLKLNYIFAQIYGII